MEKIKPVYLQLLAVAIVIFVIGVSIALTDLYNKVGQIEFKHAEEDFAQGAAAHRHK